MGFNDGPGGGIVQIILAFLLWGLVAASHAAELIPCPDCDGQVSSRAVMCPHCGCPGDAIAEAFAQLEKAVSSPHYGPLVRIDASGGSGFGLAVQSGSARYIAMDAALIWGADALTITPLTTNAPIAYRSLQIAQDVPLARFSTDNTNLAYLAVVDVPTSDTEQRPLFPPNAADTPFALGPVTSSGHPPQRGQTLSPVAVVDSLTNLVAIVCSENDTLTAVAFPRDPGWVSVQPSALRTQTRLLLRAQEEHDAGALRSETVTLLMQTDWLARSLRRVAEEMLEQKRKGEER